jgi:uncharacterized coiled-coil DUF342 family protein
MTVDFNYIWLGIGALLAIFTPIILMVNFIKAWRKDIESHTEKHDKIHYRVQAVEKDVSSAHEKIRGLESMRQNDHELIVRMSAAIDYIRESIDEIKGR